MRNDIICLADTDHAKHLARLDRLFNPPTATLVVSPNITETKLAEAPTMNFTLRTYDDISWDFGTITGPNPMSHTKKLKARDQRKKMKRHHKRRG
jgi:hypothetical protein